MKTAKNTKIYIKSSLSNNSKIQWARAPCIDLTSSNFQGVVNFRQLRIILQLQNLYKKTNFKSLTKFSTMLFKRNQGIQNKNQYERAQKTKRKLPLIAIFLFSCDVTAAMLVYGTIAKKVFWEFDSIIMQNLSDIWPLLCTPKWPSHHVGENQELTSLACTYCFQDTDHVMPSDEFSFCPS